MFVFFLFLFIFAQQVVAVVSTSFFFSSRTPLHWTLWPASVVVERWFLHIYIPIINSSGIERNARLYNGVVRKKKKKQDTPVFFSFSFFFFLSFAGGRLLDEGNRRKDWTSFIFFFFFFFFVYMWWFVFFFFWHVLHVFFFFIVLLRALSSSSFFFFSTSAAFCVFFSIFLFSFGSLMHKRSGSEDVQTRALVFTSVSFFVCLFVNVLPLQTEVVREKNENSQCGKTH